ncbi:hypothetical protein PybrP1_001140 [[Pythium] brassicae (nom. inval.)]|nr:hypothetical protein PybrP1_001140 [[Pythium] brassicae (nom. inval.)]
MLARPWRQVLRLRQPALQARLRAAASSTSSSTPSMLTAATGESSFTRYAGIAFFSTIVATTAYLGSWQASLNVQTQRYFWKVQLVEERERELHAAAVVLPADASTNSSADDIEYRQLSVTGTFKPDSTYYLYPRSAPAESTDSVATPKSGGYIYSLLERADGTPVIKGNFTPENDVKNRQFFYLQHEELARAMGVEGDALPVILDALANDGEKTGEATLAHPLRKKLQNYMEFYMTPSKHAAYAATCVAAAVLAFVRFRKGGKTPAAAKSSTTKVSKPKSG